jgi:hypothetical protein
MGSSAIGFETNDTDKLARALGAGARGDVFVIDAGSTNATSRTSAAAAVAAESTTTCPRRVGSDVAPSMSSIMSAQLVRQVR